MSSDCIIDEASFIEEHNEGMIIEEEDEECAQ